MTMRGPVDHLGPGLDALWDHFLDVAQYRRNDEQAVRKARAAIEEAVYQRLAGSVPAMAEGSDDIGSTGQDDAQPRTKTGLRLALNGCDCYTLADILAIEAEAAAAERDRIAASSVPDQSPVLLREREDQATELRDAEAAERATSGKWGGG